MTKTELWKRTGFSLKAGVALNVSGQEDSGTGLVWGLRRSASAGRSCSGQVRDGESFGCSPLGLARLQEASGIPPIFFFFVGVFLPCFYFSLFFKKSPPGQMELSFSWKLALGGMPASPHHHHLSLDPWDPGGKGEEGEKGCKGRPGGLSPPPSRGLQTAGPCLH